MRPWLRDKWGQEARLPLLQSSTEAVEAAQRQAIKQAATLRVFEYLVATNLYAPGGKAFVVMTDGIGVKVQKPTHQRVDAPKEPRA